jgi:hypothetical protein
MKNSKGLQKEPQSFYKVILLVPINVFSPFDDFIHQKEIDMRVHMDPKKPQR